MEIKEAIEITESIFKKCLQSGMFADFKSAQLASEALETIKANNKGEEDKKEEIHS